MNKLIALIILCYSTICCADELRDKTAEAFFIQSGVKDHVEERLKVYEANLPKKYKNILEIVLPIIDTVSKGKVVYKYEF